MIKEYLPSLFRISYTFPKVLRVPYLELKKFMNTTEETEYRTDTTLLRLNYCCRVSRTNGIPSSGPKSYVGFEVLRGQRVVDGKTNEQPLRNPFSSFLRNVLQDPFLPRPRRQRVIEQSGLGHCVRR